MFHNSSTCQKYVAVLCLECHANQRLLLLLLSESLLQRCELPTSKLLIQHVHQAKIADIWLFK